MRKVLLLLLVFISIISIMIGFGYRPLVNYLGLQPRAGLRVSSADKANVYINDHQVGETPYQDDSLKEGEYLISLKVQDEGSSSGKQWKGYIRLNGGTITAVNRDLADTPAVASGEIISLEKGKGVTIISTPPGAEVAIDGKVVGRSPVVVDSVSAGEHLFLINKENFVKRSIRATAIDGYNLTLTVDLAISEPDLTKLPTIPVSSTSQVVVKQTPTGFLRVRNTPSTDGAVVATVAPGDILTLLEELPNWDRVRLVDGKEGYIASTYAEKKTNQP